MCAEALGTKDFRSMTSDFYDQDDPKLLEFVARHTLPRRGIIADEDEIYNFRWQTHFGYQLRFC